MGVDAAIGWTELCPTLGGGELATTAAAVAATDKEGQGLCGITVAMVVDVIVDDWAAA